VWEADAWIYLRVIVTDAGCSVNQQRIESWVTETPPDEREFTRHGGVSFVSSALALDPAQGGLRFASRVRGERSERYPR